MLKIMAAHDPVDAFGEAVAAEKIEETGGVADDVDRLDRRDS
jgi:hypothetical protein